MTVLPGPRPRPSEIPWLVLLSIAALALVCTYLDISGYLPEWLSARPGRTP